MDRNRERREVTVDGNQVVYTWVRSRRRRHTHLVMDERNGLELRGPVSLTAFEADRLVMRSGEWIRAAEGRRQRQQDARVVLEDGARLPCGELTVELRLRTGHRQAVSLRGDQLVVQGNRLDEAAVRRLLERWYRERAHDVFWPRLNLIGEPHGLRPASLTIRAQKTRWGSCSSAGRINLNWRLLLLPGALSDYVLTHELCHLRHMNHSRDFWALLASIMPDYAEREHQVNSITGNALAL